MRSLKVTGKFGTKDALKLRLAPADNSGTFCGPRGEGKADAIEAVLLSDGKGRRTACLSTQAGCAVGCVFCQTGRLGLARSLSSHEIIEQFFWLQDAAGGEPLDNVVFMGMGEPLHNLTELSRAISVLEDALGFSWRRITVSTSGAASGIRALTETGPRCRLSFSLVTAIESKRARLMPRSSPLSEIQDALYQWQKKYASRLTLEIPLLGSLNTSEDDADSVAVFAAGFDSIVVNLIPWNSVSGLTFEGRPLVPPTAAEIRSYSDSLAKKGLKTVLRRSKGASVSAACGQLGSA